MARISIEEQFTYHPPTTEERKKKHQSVNDAALAFAKVVGAIVPDDDPMYQSIIGAIQQSRMLANQAITYQELRSRGDGD